MSNTVEISQKEYKRLLAKEQELVEDRELLESTQDAMKQICDKNIQLHERLKVLEEAFRQIKLLEDSYDTEPEVLAQILLIAEKYQSN